MKNQKRFSINKSAGYAVLSTAAFASLVLVPSVVAHADVVFTGTTSFKGEVLITSPVQLTDGTINGSLKDAKVVINLTNPGATINLANIVVNNIEIRSSAKLTGSGLGNAQVVLKPESKDSVIDLSGSNATNIIIGNNNVKTITVADNVTKITIADGVTAANPTILDEDGKPRNDVKFVPETPVVVDKTVLEKAITDAETALVGAKEGTADGEYTVGSIKKLEDVITASEVVLKNEDATTEDVTSAVSELEKALSTFLAAKNSSFNLSIMHFNDTHAHLDNAAKRVTAVKEVRAAKPNALLLDAGDVFSGTLYFNEFLGQADLEFMNLMKVDAMTFGNHEFDLGSSAQGHKALADFIKAAKFPFVSSNVDFSQDELLDGLFNTKISATPENANIYTGIVKVVDGQKVGIFGLTTADTKDISSPGKVTFSNYIEDAKKMVAEFEKMGINKIVAITHIGYDDNPAVDNDLELAKAVKGIDVIVGGHSHTALAAPVLIDTHTEPTIIVQTGQYAESLGTLDVTFNGNGVVTAHNGKLIKIADKVADPEAAEMLKK